ncbi:DHS-like NAD/FAD-binding domain-containing protein [Parathielavia appendiculata]|uniref:DHS-like NAD/FAD-binding domain-containing protein n=1 Tax=Parathielavia appendiculata TaxID=2587402 RepID=A0AAN6U880_9PEZI|nr:DHS-like NAD/FAD-binding domain-containing protein [Parathielavia appendiculata]
MAESTDEIRVRTDGPPPAKRRRTAGPTKPRTTAYIDLENPRGDGEDENLERLISALRKKKKIVVIAGAGISVSAGIPDFRSSTGLFATLRGQHKLKACGKHLFDASVYKHDSSTESFHAMVRELAQMTAGAKPTPFHHMLASIAAEGRLMRMYSQNIDTLDTQMPPLATTVPLNCKGPWPTTIQLHGGLEKMVCTKCGHLEPFNASLFQGPEPPLCENCKEQDQVRTTFAGKRSHGIGRLRPRIVLYNEYNPDEEAIGNVSKADLRRVPDAVIVVGTSLKIPGVRRIVKEMCQLTRSRRDGITAWINLEPEPQGVEFKDCWDLVVRGKCDDIAELVSLPRWDQQDIGEPDTYMISGDEQREKRCADCLNRGRIDVLLEARRRTSVDQEGFGSSVEAPSAAGREPKLLRNGGMPTPSASPRVRSPLPSVKPMAKPATKQSTLVFGNSAVSKPAAKPRKGATNKRNPRQPKKEPIKPRNRLDQTFRTIKAAAAAAVPSKDKDNAKTPQNRPSSEEEADSSSSDLSSPLDLPGDYLSLPSLRPTPSVGKKPSPLKVSPHPPPSNSSGPLGALGWAAAEGKGTAASASSEPPRTPTENTNADNAPGVAATISPKSKPRSMGHLID